MDMTGCTKYSHPSIYRASIYRVPRYTVHISFPPKFWMIFSSLWKNEILSQELPKLVNFSKKIACGGQLVIKVVVKIAIFIIFKLFLVLVYYYSIVKMHSRK